MIILMSKVFPKLEKSFGTRNQYIAVFVTYYLILHITRCQDNHKKIILQTQVCNHFVGHSNLL